MKLVIGVLKDLVFFKLYYVIGVNVFVIMIMVHMVQLHVAWHV